jgi:hypothetical protein
LPSTPPRVTEKAETPLEKALAWVQSPRNDLASKENTSNPLVGLTRGAVQERIHEAPEKVAEAIQNRAKAILASRSSFASWTSALTTADPSYTLPKISENVKTLAERGNWTAQDKGLLFQQFELLHGIEMSLGTVPLADAYAARFVRMNAQALGFSDRPIYKTLAPKTGSALDPKASVKDPALQGKVAEGLSVYEGEVAYREQQEAAATGLNLEKGRPSKEPVQIEEFTPDERISNAQRSSEFAPEQSQKAIAEANAQLESMRADLEKRAQERDAKAREEIPTPISEAERKRQNELGQKRSEELHQRNVAALQKEVAELNDGGAAASVAASIKHWTDFKVKAERDLAEAAKLETKLAELRKKPYPRGWAVDNEIEKTEREWKSLSNDAKMRVGIADHNIELATPYEARVRGTAQRQQLKIDEQLQENARQFRDKSEQIAKLRTENKAELETVNSRIAALDAELAAAKRNHQDLSRDHEAAKNSGWQSLLRWFGIGKAAHQSRETRINELANSIRDTQRNRDLHQSTVEGLKANSTLLETEKKNVDGAAASTRDSLQASRGKLDPSVDLSTVEEELRKQGITLKR